MFSRSRKLRSLEREHRDSDYLCSEPQIALSVYLAIGHQRRAAGDKVGDAVGNLLEFARL